MKQRITRSKIQQYDLVHEEDESCLVRLLEMTVDHTLHNHPYIMQFWNDVEVYGLDEAIVYLKKQFPPTDYTEFDKVTSEIKQALQTPAGPMKGNKMYQVSIPNSEVKERSFEQLQAAFNWMQELVQNGFFDIQLKVV